MRSIIQSLKNFTPASLKNWRRVFYSWGMILGGGFFVFQVISGIRSLVQRQQVFGQPHWLILAAILSVVITWMQMMGWRWMMAGLNKRLSWNDVLQGYILSFIPRYIPGTVWGYITRAEWLNKAFDISYGLTNLGSVLEMVFILLANVAWIITGWVPTFWERSLTLTLPLLMAGLCWLGLRWSVVKAGLARIFGSEAANAIDGISLRRWVLITGWMVLFWGIQGLSFQMAIWSVNDPTVTIKWSFTEFFMVSSSYNLAWFVGFVILFVPAGLGMRETILTKLIDSRLTHATGMASVISILFRIILASGEAFWAVVSLRNKQSLNPRKGFKPEISQKTGPFKE